MHDNFTHALFAVVILLAHGQDGGRSVPLVGDAARVLWSAAIAGALAYALVPGLQTPLIGAYPAVYGLIGAFTFLLWVNLAAVGANKYRAFTLIGFLLGIQLLFGLVFGGGWEWVADLAGFATGFVLVLRGQPGRLGAGARQDPSALTAQQRCGTPTRRNAPRSAPDAEIADQPRS